MKKTVLKAWIGCLVAALLIPAMVTAGYKYTKPVAVLSGRFEGSIGTARNSANAIEYIGCAVVSGTGYCYAMDASGTPASCSTTDSDHLVAIYSLNSESFVQVYHSSGTCTLIYTSVMSYMDVAEH